MRTIHPPRATQRSGVACAEALEPALMQLVERAECAGWTANEVLRALCLLTWRFAQEPAVAANTDRPGRAPKVASG